MKASNFRFKVWDNEDKKFVRMVDEDRIPTENTKQGFKLKSVFELFLTTGLKDTAAKEIYDGDLLEFSLHPYFERSYVTFEDGAFKIDYNGNVVNLAEAIGDIHRLDGTIMIVGHRKKKNS